MIKMKTKSKVTVSDGCKWKNTFFDIVFKILLCGTILIFAVALPTASEQGKSKKKIFNKFRNRKIREKK